MTVTISGSTGIANPLGSASSPAETNTTSSNTGAYFPTSTTYGIATNGTNAMYVDGSQNVGIGTISPTVYGSYKTLEVRGTGGGLVQFGTGATTASYLYSDGTNAGFTNISNGVMTFSTSNTERMRIDSSGNLLVGTTSTGGSNNGLTLGSGYQLWITYSGYSNFRYGMYLGDIYWNNGSDRMKLSSAGALQTTTGTISALSDINYKENVIDAPNYLSLLNEVKVRKFSYKEEKANTQTHIGVIAQELETVLPEMVSVSNSSDGSKEYKVVRYTDFTMMLVKSVQELTAEITAIKAEFDAYKASHP
jgi:hypothetical protein